MIEEALCMARMGDRVGTLCKQLGRSPRLRRIIGDSPGGASLAELARAVAAFAEPDLMLLARLLDEIKDAGARAGAPGITGVGTRADSTGVRLQGVVIEYVRCCLGHRLDLSAQTLHPDGSSW
jgi:hypothetical protein